MTSEIRYLTPEAEARELARAADRVADRRISRLMKAIQDHQFDVCAHPVAGSSNTVCAACAADFILSGNAAEAMRFLELEPAPIFRPQGGQRWVVPIGPAAAARVEAIKAALADETDFMVRHQRYEIPPLAPIDPCLDGLVVSISGSGETEAPWVELRPLGCCDNPGVKVTFDYLIEHGRLG